MYRNGFDQIGVKLKFVNRRKNSGCVYFSIEVSGFCVWYVLYKHVTPPEFSFDTTLNAINMLHLQR